MEMEHIHPFSAFYWNILIERRGLLSRKARLCISLVLQSYDIERGKLIFPSFIYYSGHNMYEFQAVVGQEDASKCIAEISGI